MKYYKVLRRFNKKLVSANVHFYQRYFTNKINLPRIPESKLFVFTNIDSAEHFRSISMSQFPCFIYEVEVTNPFPVDSLILTAGSVSSGWRTDRADVINSWKNFVKTKRWDTRSCYVTFAPRNTVLCDSIKIIKLIK